MRQHGALTIVVDILPGKKQELRDKFKEIEALGTDSNPIIPFAKLSTIHFSRFVVFDEGEDALGGTFPPRMIFSTNYDLPYDNHLNELVQHAGRGLWDIFSLCVKGPSGEYSDAKILEYLKGAAGKTDTFYVGVGQRSVSQIRNENILREEIEQFADAHRAEFKGQDAGIIRNKIIDFVNNNPDLAWAKTPAPKRSFAENVAWYSRLGIALLITLVLLPIIIPFAIVWIFLILYDEITKEDIVRKVDKNHFRTLVDRENTIVQQQFSALGNLKPGFVRRNTMKYLLAITDFLAPYLFSKGRLSGIPTVQFARWVIINEGKQMIFLSNFDGNSENYLRDFINIAGKQLNLIFCHTVGMPKTRFMVFGGTKDADGFVAWARYFQVISNVWYSANKDVTVKNIFNNSEIRDGLYGTMSEYRARKWLNKI
jgi:hypothetical protein